MPPLPFFEITLGARADIEQVHEACRELGPAPEDYTPPRVTEGDEGLITFTVSDAQAVLVDQLNFCGDGGECIKPVNCATRFTHAVALYVRSGNGWRTAFSIFASDKVFVSTEYGTEKFQALVLKVFPGDWGCPEKEHYRDTCPVVVKWNGKQFTRKPL